GVAAGREHLGDAGRLETLVGHAEGGAQARATGAHDDDVVLVIDHGVGVAADMHRAGRGAVGLGARCAVSCLGHDQPPKPIRRMATMAPRPKSTAMNLVATISATRVAPLV